MKRLRDESGFTVIEGVVACMLITIGGLATLQIFTASAKNTIRSEQNQVVNARLQAELEKIKALPYSQVAMTEGVAAVANPNDPRSRVSGSTFAVAESGGSDFSPMAVDATNGKVVPGPTAFTSGDVSGHLYRYVVWRNDPKCPETSCPGSEDLKRVIVAATLIDTPSTGPRSYHELHTEISDPDATPVDPGNPEGAGECPSSGCTEVPSQFWLTDTPCNFTSRQPIGNDHPLHNTRANCSQGLGNGVTRGAPDLMFTQAPRLDESYGPSQQPQYDYASDVEPPSDATLDKGLIVRPQSGTGAGCVASPVLDSSNLTRYVDFAATEPNPEQKMHKWLSASVPTDRSLVLTGEGTLSIWTRTVNGAAYDGKICVWLFVRTTVSGPLGSVRRTCRSSMRRAPAAASSPIGRNRAPRGRPTGRSSRSTCGAWTSRPWIERWRHPQSGRPPGPGGRGRSRRDGEHPGPRVPLRPPELRQQARGDHGLAAALLIAVGADRVAAPPR